MPFASARLLCATSTIALTCAIATAPAAQEAVELDEIFVTGELQERTLQDSPTSALVVRGEELEARGDVDVYDLIERAPNVSTTFGNKGFVLRGIQANGAVSNVQLNGTLVSVQVDGVALNNYQSTFFGPYSSWDLGQVEILRGPQSTQQGRNAMAGAIIFESNDPQFFSEYRGRLELGSRNTRRLAFAVNETLSDTVAFRLSGEKNTTDGYVTSRALGDDEYDARDYTEYRAKLRFQPSDVFDAVVSYSYTDSTGGEDYVLDSEFPSERVTDQTADALEGSEHKNLGVEATYDIGDNLTLQVETNFYDQDYTRVEGDDPQGQAQSLIEIFGGSDTFEQDVQLKFETDTFSGVAGVFYTDTKDQRPVFSTFDLAIFAQGNFAALAPAITGNIGTIDDQFDTEVENFALYGEVDYDLSDRLKATLGARYDIERFTYTQSVTYGGALANPLIIGAINGLIAPAQLQFPNVAENSDTREFDAFLPKLGLTYDIDADQSVSFTFQRGYRAGGVSANFITAELSEYDPEYSTNYEVAYRGSLRDGRLNVRANAFYTRWKDMQISVPGTPTNLALDALFNFDTANAAESEIMGFEVGMDAAASDNMQLFGAVGYTKTEFLEFESGTNDFAGKEFPFSPKFTVNLGAEYTWDSDLALGVDVSYKGESFQNSDNTTTDDARTLLNTQLTYPINDNLTAGLYVRNLLDTAYATSRVVSANPTIVRTGEPRTVGVYLQADY